MTEVEDIPQKFHTLPGSPIVVSMNITDEQKDHVRNLLIRGHKIEAVKYIRDNFGLSLRESKQLAELIDEDIADDEYQSPPLVFKRASASKAGSAIGLIFGLIGAAMLSVVIYIFLSHQKFLDTAVPVVGVVVSNPHQPVIDFEYEGTMHSYYSSVSSSPPSYHMGEEVEIFVNPADPDDVMVNTFTERWFLIVLLGGMGVMFFGIGTVAFFAFKRKV